MVIQPSVPNIIIIGINATYTFAILTTFLFLIFFTQKFLIFIYCSMMCAQLIVHYFQINCYQFYFYSYLKASIGFNLDAL